MSTSIDSVAVVGLGTMGQGIAAAVAAAGHPVRVFDQPDQLDACVATLHRRYERLRAATGIGVEKPALAAAPTVARAIDGADLVIEAVPEELDLKQHVLGQLGGAVGPTTIVATNTSSLPLSALEPAVPDARRFLATHFFNPAEVVPGVEVAAASRTDDDVVAAVTHFLRAVGKEPIVVGAAAGFVANRIQLALFLEALACVEDGLATPEEVDAVVRRTIGFRLPAYGPFAIADMAGLDVYASILAVLREAHGPRFETPPRLRELVEQGRIGTKTGAGFGDYTSDEVAELVAGRDERYRRLLAAAD